VRVPVCTADVAQSTLSESTLKKWECIFRNLVIGVDLPNIHINSACSPPFYLFFFSCFSKVYYKNFLHFEPGSSCTCKFFFC